MKKLIPLLLAVFVFTACEKDADTDQLKPGPRSGQAYSPQLPISAHPGVSASLFHTRSPPGSQQHQILMLTACHPELGQFFSVCSS